MGRNAFIHCARLVKSRVHIWLYFQRKQQHPVVIVLVCDENSLTLSSYLLLCWLFYWQYLRNMRSDDRHSVGIGMMVSVFQRWWIVLDRWHFLSPGLKHHSWDVLEPYPFFLTAELPPFALSFRQGDWSVSSHCLQSEEKSKVPNQTSYKANSLAQGLLLPSSLVWVCKVTLTFWKARLVVI